MTRIIVVFIALIVASIAALDRKESDGMKWKIVEIIAIIVAIIAAIGCDLGGAL
jgi:hypothetical protein